MVASVLPTKEATAEMASAAPRLPLPGHRVAVDERHDRRLVAGDVEQDAGDAPAVHGAVIDGGQQDEGGFGPQAEGEGERDQDGDAVGRAEPGQRADEGADEGAEQRRSPRLSGVRATAKPSPSRRRRLHGQPPKIAPAGSGSPSSVVEQEVEDDARCDSPVSAPLATSPRRPGARRGNRPASTVDEHEAEGFEHDARRRPGRDQGQALVAPAARGAGQFGVGSGRSR